MCTCLSIYTIFIAIRGGSRTPAISKMERFVIIVTIITKRSILDVAAVLDPPLIIICVSQEELSLIVYNHLIYDL